MLFRGIRDSQSTDNKYEFGVVADVADENGFKDPLREEGVSRGSAQSDGTLAAGGFISQIIRDIRDIYKYIVILHRVRLSRMAF